MLRNRVAVVMGGASPLTPAVALAAAKQEAAVVIISAAEKEASETIMALKAEKVEASFIYCDPRIEADLKVVIANILQKYKRIDILLHVADFYEEKWERVQHLKSVMFATKAVMPCMIKQQYGRVVLVASMLGDAKTAFTLTRQSEPPNQYTTSKIGILSFVRAAAMDLAQCNITVNAVEAGLLSPLNSQECEKIPLGRPAKPEEIAAPATFLASDGASYITGQWICVNGGLSLTNGVNSNGNGHGHGNGNGSGYISPGNGNGNGGNGTKSGYSGGGTGIRFEPMVLPSSSGSGSGNSSGIGFTIGTAPSRR